MAAFLYFIDGLELMSKLYGSILKEFKKNYNLGFIKKLKTYLGDKIPDDVCDKVNNKFLTFFS
jgi:hypothetical protein